MTALNAIVIIPLLGVGAVWLARHSASTMRGVALGFAIVELVACAWLANAAMTASGAALAFGAPVSGVAVWALRLDGLSVPLAVLTALLSVVAILASWKVEVSPWGHFALLLGLEAALIVVFLADSVVLFYVGWEAVLIPMFFLIGGWGHENRRHAAMKFFLYTFAGSAFMLVGLVIVLVSTHAASIPDAARLLGQPPAAFAAGLPPIAVGTPTLVFWLLVIGFAVKVPIVPFHTWLPDAHVEAPTAGSIMLAGVLLKMGGYGLLRLALPFAPEAARAAGPLLAAFGIVGIVYGALMALAQSDLKRLVAYSSVSHMGFVVLAVAVGTPLALTAAMLVMVAHGLVSALLFLLVGMLQERTGTRDLARFGGLLRTTPVWGTAFVFAALAGLGLPGLAGFPGELLTLLEGYAAYRWWMAAVAAGIVLAGVYSLRAIRHVAHGPERTEWRGMPDLDARELSAVAPLVLAILALGIWPSFVAAAASPVATAIAGLLGRG